MAGSYRIPDCLTNYKTPSFLLGRLFLGFEVLAVAQQHPSSWCQPGHRRDYGHSLLLRIDHAPQPLSQLVSVLLERSAARLRTVHQESLVLMLNRSKVPPKRKFLLVEHAFESSLGEAASKHRTSNS